MKWHIGEVTVTKIVELEFTGGTRFILPQAICEAVRDLHWLKPHFMNDEGQLVMSVQADAYDRYAFRRRYGRSGGARRRRLAICRLNRTCHVA